MSILSFSTETRNTLHRYHFSKRVDRKFVLENPDILDSITTIVRGHDHVVGKEHVTQLPCKDLIYVDAKWAKLPTQMLSHLISEFRNHWHLDGAWRPHAISCHFLVDFIKTHQCIRYMCISDNILWVADQWHVRKKLHI